MANENKPKYLEFDILDQKLYLPNNTTTKFLVDNNPTIKDCLGNYANWKAYQIGDPRADIDLEDMRKEIAERLKKGEMKQVAEAIYEGGVIGYGSDLVIYDNILSVDQLDMEPDYSDLEDYIGKK